MTLWDAPNTELCYVVNDHNKIATSFAQLTLRPRQNGRHFADDTFKHIFLNENVWISIEIPLKFVPKGPINNIPALVQIIAWRWPGDKALSEPMMVRLPTHICVSRPQWVKGNIFGFFHIHVANFSFPIFEYEWYVGSVKSINLHKKEPTGHVRFIQSTPWLWNICETIVSQLNCKSSDNVSWWNYFFAIM